MLCSMNFVSAASESQSERKEWGREGKATNYWHWRCPFSLSFPTFSQRPVGGEDSAPTSEQCRWRQVEWLWPCLVSFLERWQSSPGTHSKSVKFLASACRRGGGAPDGIRHHLLQGHLGLFLGYQIQGHDQELIFPLLLKDNLEPLRPGPTPVAPECLEDSTMLANGWGSPVCLSCTSAWTESTRYSSHCTWRCQSDHRQGPGSAVWGALRERAHPGPPAGRGAGTPCRVPRCDRPGCSCRRPGHTWAWRHSVWFEAHLCAGSFSGGEKSRGNCESHFSGRDQGS